MVLLKRSIIISTLLVFFTALNIYHLPAAKADDPIPGLSKEQLDKYIHDYILEHPEVIVQSIQRWQAQQKQAQAQQATAMLRERHDEIFNDADAPVSGNAEGDVTVVEFMDYNCGYCRKVFPTITQLLQQDKNIRVVFKEFPVLGEGSQYAARAALAAQRQGQYMAFHDALMTAKQRLAKRQVLAIAKKVGLDVDKLEQDMDDPQVQAMLDRNHALARALAINGTPGFIIGDEIVRGATSLANLKALVAKARQQSK